MRALRRDDTGAAPVEFVLVGTMLTALTLAVLQLALVMYVRNAVHDAAVEGAYVGALADAVPDDGAQRTRQLIASTAGRASDAEVSAEIVDAADGPQVQISVTATLPLFGLWGLPAALEVTAHAPRESFD